MRNYYRFGLTLGIAALVSALPVQAESKRKSEDEAGVQRAIAFQRAKDRADARQARKEAKNPEHFTYAQPQNTSPNSLSKEQRKGALDKSEGTADREAPPK